MASPDKGKWPLVVTVTDQSSGAQNWSWSFGDGSTASGPQPPAHTYGSAGTYTISLTVSSARGETKTVTKQTEVRSRIGEVATTLGPYGGVWGGWQTQAMCPNGTLAYAFDVQVERNQGGGDDTALNGIRLGCGQADVPTGEITSGQGPWGSWLGSKQCAKGQYLVGAKMMIERPLGGGDDTAADNVTFRCTAGSELVITHNAEFGAWSDLQMCPADTAICGIQTRVEGDQHGGDDTALNDAKFVCCYSR
jgi:hypothetical protein